MIWVIGDIHGMFDPLKRLFAGIRKREYDGEAVEKIIFIGDYMDRGPSSREVIDYILALEYETVFLAGNHEDMAIRFFEQDEKYLRDFGNQWFPNGGVDTYESIFDAPEYGEMLADIQKCRDPFISGDHCDTFKGRELPKKYEDFIRGVRYTHREEIPFNGTTLGVSFFHGLPRWDQTLSEQRVVTYAQFEEYRKQERSYYGLYTPATEQFHPTRERDRPWPLSIEGSFLWGRVYNYRDGYGGDIVIHGHTPTLGYEKYFLTRRRENLVEDYASQFESYDAGGGLPFLFSRGKGAGYSQRCSSREDAESESSRNAFFNCGEGGALEAINVDTGAVFGVALTALGLSTETLEQGQLPLLTAFTSGNNAAGRRPLARTIYVRALGSPGNVAIRKERR
ncbi:MAG: metallophosphoesterase [Synergistaceae bacterium]|jgi:hypothetical protein|nr:metallophosphoesterase [Synergistaceae bacterium]